ncbi:MAG: hypothetical protein H7Z12_04760 [Rhodospirillaceae bacterium]|nr:hypothetical protein [Rhodospirillales bacterium]
MAQDEQYDRELQLLFGGKPTDGHVVPTSVLTQALQSLQRAVHILGMRHEGKDVRQRMRISADVELRYAVLCKLPEPGSYISPIIIGDTSQTLFDGAAIMAVTKEFKDLLAAVNEQDAVKVRSILPDPVYRTPVLSALAKMAPPKRSGIVVDLQTRGGRSLFAPAKASKFVEHVLERPITDATVTTVTGRLIGIDFSGRALRLHYPPTRRELTCYYHEAVEEMLLDNPREFIQVVGQVVLDRDGEPEKIIEVERILEVDLSPFIVTNFISGNKVLRARRPITFSVTLDESVQYHCIESGEFGIDIIASTREELEHDMQQELDMLWRQYAQEQDDKLTESARTLKLAMLEAFEVAQ